MSFRKINLKLCEKRVYLTSTLVHTLTFVLGCGVFIGGRWVFETDHTLEFDDSELSMSVQTVIKENILWRIFSESIAIYFELTTSIFT